MNLKWSRNTTTITRVSSCVLLNIKFQDVNFRFIFSSLLVSHNSIVINKQAFVKISLLQTLFEIQFTFKVLSFRDTQVLCPRSIHKPS